MNIDKNKLEEDIQSMSIHHKFGHSFDESGTCTQCGFILKNERIYTQYQQIHAKKEMFSQKNRYNILVNYIYRIRNGLTAIGRVIDLLVLTINEEETKKYFSILKEEGNKKKKCALEIKNNYPDEFKEKVNISSYKDFHTINPLVEKEFLKTEFYNYIQYKYICNNKLNEEDIKAINDTKNDKIQLNNINKDYIMDKLLQGNFIPENFIDIDDIPKITNAVFLAKFFYFLYNIGYMYFLNDIKNGVNHNEETAYDKRLTRYAEKTMYQIYKIDKNLVIIKNLGYYSIDFIEFAKIFTPEELTDIFNPMTMDKIILLEKVIGKRKIKIEIE